MTTLIKKYLPVIILAMTGMLGQNLKAQDFTISQDAVSCNVGQGRIILNVIAGTGPFDYYLYDHDPFLPGGPLQSVENSPFDTVVFIDVPLSGPTYYIRFRATEGTLIRTTTVTIAQTQQLTANIFVAQALSCPSSTDAVLSTTVSGGNPPYTYLWGPGGQDTPSITVGQGVYSVSVNDSYNCQNSQSEPTYFFLEGDDSIPTALVPGSVASSHTICINTSPSGFTNVVFADGGWGHTYQWQDSISGGSWQNIPGATSDSYDDPNNLLQTRYYRRAAISTSGCGTVYSNILTVTVVAAPVAEAGGNITICSGTSAIAMTGASGTGSFSAATWSGGAGMGTWSQNANPALATFTPSIASGTFTATLILTGSYGCSNSTDTRTITWGTPPVAEAGNAIASCTGMAAITMTGATATGTFSAATWSGGAGLGIWTQNGNPALAVFTPTVTSGSFTATLTLTGSNGCGDVTDTRTISWGTAPVAEAGSNISSCTGMSAILMTGATATGTYSAATWSGGAGSGTWTQNADPALATFTPTVASGSFTATLTLTGTNGCGNATDTRTISWGTAPTADADGDITSCTGMGALTMTGATATGTFSAVTWSGGAGLGNWTQNGNPALAVFTPTVASGSFTATLTLTGSNGCGNSTDTRLITWGTAPIAEAGSNIASCTGMAAIQMTGATASGTYSAVTWSGGVALGIWTQNGNPALATFTPTAASGSFTATLTLTGSNGCSNSTDTRTISWGTAPTAEAGSDITSCTGTASITMTGATASGTYTVVTWSGGTGMGTWVQNTDPALATFTPSLASGSFTATLTLTGTNGCSNATDTRTITWGTAPTAEAGNDITSCTGMAALAMSGATANGTFSATTWSGGAGLGTWTQNANPALATFTPTVASGSFTATLTLTGNNGCGNASDTRLITWGTAPTAEAGANISTCTGLAAILMTGATSNGTFSAVTWTGGAGLGTWTQNANPALATFTPTLASGSFTATLTLTGSNGCGNATDTRTISWGIAPTAEAGNDITTCTGTSAISMTGASGTGTFSAATWSGGAGLGTWTQNVDPALATFTPTVASGSFTATLTLTGSNGCSNSADTRLLTWGTAPVAEAGTDITSCTGMAAITMTGATATGTFSAVTWSGGGGLGSWTQNPNPALATFTPSIASGSFTATLTLTGTNGCGNATDIKTITWGTAPTAEAGSNIITCTGTAAIAMTGATANGTFSAVTWSGGAALGTWIQNVNPALATFTPTAASGSFTATLTLTGSNGCGNATDTRTITWGTAPTVEAGSDITTCTGLSPILMTGSTASGTYSAVTWSGGAALGTWTQNANPALARFTPTVASGSFTATLTITGSNGCGNVTDTRLITWGTAPVADAGNNIASCTGLSAIAMSGATATGTFSASTWSGGAGLGTWTQNANPALATFTPTVASGSFTATLTLTGSNGCSDATDTRTIAWGTAPIADAGTDITSCTGTAAITMTGATATGTFSAATWTGGAGLGTWAQNVDPALATFTPTTASGTFTATLTLTGTNGCSNSTDTRIISWGTAPTAEAGSDITSCTGTLPIAMTGATANGTYSAATWTGGAGLGTWTQNANPALATFTPTVASGSFTATLTLTGSNGCGNAIDTRIITWGTPPAAEAGTNIASCTGMAAILMSGATATGTYSAVNWSGGAGLGTWTQNIDPALAVFTPTTISGSFTATLTLTGTNGCSNATDTRIISWGTAPIAEAGSDIASCTGLTAISMTGATAGGTYTAVTWSGGSGLGVWVQNTDPALATFTPSVASGSFTATLTLTGSNGCGNATDTRTISWGTAPTTDAGNDITSCTGMTPIAMTGATTAGTFSAATWTGGAGLGTWTQNANPSLASFTPSVASGSFTATLTLTGSNGCGNATDTRLISWGTAPVANAGTDISSCSGMAAILMTGATATGTFSSATWTGGTGLGAWTQNANPALASFTPTQASGSFTATLTLTGSNGCSNAIATRVISWGTAPTVDAGLNISSCTGLSAISMTGATATGTYSAATWSGGIASGTWTQNINPALAIFTPTTPSGSFVATLTLTGSNGCGNVSDTRTISWNTTPTVNAGMNDSVCFSSTNYLLEGNAANYNTVQWSIVSGFGTFQGGINNVLNPTYQFGVLDYGSGNGSVVILQLQANGLGACASTIVRDTVEIRIAPEVRVSIGSPAPFYINPNTEIEVCLSTSGHQRNLDMGYYLMAPDGETMLPLKKGPQEFNFFTPCTPVSGGIPGDVVDLCFTTELDLEDTLNICTHSRPISGTYAATGDWSILYGMNPAEGGWGVVVKDTANNRPTVFDGNIIEASISFIDTATATGRLKTINYESGVISIPIIEQANTTYMIPRGLQVSCAGECDAIGLVNVTGGTSPYLNYTWSPAPMGGNGTDSVVFCPGTYSLTVTDAMGCTGTTSVIVTEPPAIVINTLAYTDTLSCYGDTTGSITVTATGGAGGLEFTLLPGNIPSETPGSGTFSNLAAGAYTVHIEDINGCYTDTTITIHQIAQLTLVSAAVTDSVFCSGDLNGRIAAVASGGTLPYTYILEPGTITNSTGIFDNLGPGSYIIRVTDANNCDTIISDSLILGVPQALLIDTVIIKPISCNGDQASVSVVVTGGRAPYDIYVNGTLEQSGITDTAIFFRAAGNYDIRVTDANLCDTSWSTITLTDPAIITIDSIIIVPIETCYSDPVGAISVYASGGTGSIEYSLDSLNFQSTNDFTGLTGGPYTIYVQDSNSCMVIIDTLIPSPPQILGNPIVTHVEGVNLGSIELFPTGGIPFTVGEEYRYSIDGGPLTTESIFDSLTAGTYQIHVEDSVGCPWDTTIIIRIVDLDITVIAFDADCWGEPSGEIRVYINDGTAPYTVYLDGDIVYDNEFNNFVIIGSVYPGTYTVGVLDNDGRFNDSTVTVNSPGPLGAMRLITHVSCNEYNLDGSSPSDGALSYFGDGGAGGYTYRWQDTSSQDSIRQNLPVGTYYVTITDRNGCTYIDYSTLRALDTLAAEINLVPIDPNGIFDAGDVLDYPSPDNDSLCFNSTWGLIAENNYFPVQYHWEPDTMLNNPADSMQQDVEFTLREPVIFSLTVNNTRCMDRDTIWISMHDTMNIQIESDGYRVGDSIFDPLEKPLNFFTTDGYIEYYWLSFNPFDDETSRTPVLIPTVDQPIMVRGTTPAECYEYDSVYVIIQQPLDSIADVFTPNGDGINDTWLIPHALQFPDLEVYIFNRWGQQVFYSSPYGTDDHHTWDGTSQKNGKELPIGTYYYIIKPNDGQQDPVTGTVTIVR